MRLLSYRQLVEEKGLRYSRTHLRRLMYDPNYAHLGFPKCVEVSPGRIAWYEHEIDAYLKSRPRREARVLPDDTEHLIEIPPSVGWPNGRKNPVA